MFWCWAVVQLAWSGPGGVAQRRSASSKRRAFTITFDSGSARMGQSPLTDRYGLYRTDGIRGLSGSDRLRMMGFASD